MEHRQHYAHGALDRADERRQDPAWLAERLGDPATRIHPVSAGRNLIGGAEGRSPVALSPEEAAGLADLSGAILLGLDQGVAHFALDLGAADDEALARRFGARLTQLRDLAGELPHAEAALLAYARGMVHWHHGHRFCGWCGSETRMERAGHARACVNEACGKLNFPRTDPAVITLVIDGERCLLARRRIWPKGRRSTIAGFVEPGETLEDAVRREIQEEVGVRVGRVAYQGSQPWPFPASLMLGFRAWAETTQITVDGEEIEEAGWYSRAEIARDAAEGTLLLPPADSISHWLVQSWRDEDRVFAPKKSPF